MRILAALAVLAFIGCAAAQPRAHYDLYISSQPTGADVYAFTGNGHAAAVQVVSCGNARLLENAAAVVSAVRSRSGAGVTRITVSGDGTQIGMCDADDLDDPKDEAEHGDEHENIVVIEDLTAQQTRRMISSFTAAPEPVRQQLLTALAL